MVSLQQTEIFSVLYLVGSVLAFLIPAAACTGILGIFLIRDYRKKIKLHASDDNVKMPSKALLVIGIVSTVIFAVIVLLILIMIIGGIIIWLKK